MESSNIEWSQCTPYFIDSKKVFRYNQFQSPYKNIRFMLRQASSYTVTKSDMGRIATISYRVYGTTTLWRVILEYNQIQDPITELYPGVVLALPDKAQATAYLSSINTVSSTASNSMNSFVI